jgi:hypothetical protein
MSAGNELVGRGAATNSKAGVCRGTQTEEEAFYLNEHERDSPESLRRIP